MFYCLYSLIFNFYYYFPQRMKGKLSTELDSILQELKDQNNQINSTLKSLKKVKSVDILPSKASRSVIEYINTEKIIKSNQIE